MADLTPDARAHNVDESVRATFGAGATDGRLWLAVSELTPLCVYARSRTTETALVQLPDSKAGPWLVVRKRWWWPRARDRVKGAFRTTIAARSPARREFDALTRLAALPGGPFAPLPLGAFEERSGGVLQSCGLLVTALPDTTDLSAWLARKAGSATLVNTVLADLAVRVAAMHDAGLVDKEMHPRNVLVDPVAKRTWKIDVAKQRASRGVARPVSPSAAIDDLACLDVGLSRLATAEERSAFLSAYVEARRPRLTLDAAQLSRKVAARRAHHDPKEAPRLPPAGDLATQ